jgi:hypothetical protein
MKNYDDEATQYQNSDNEAPQFAGTAATQTNNETSPSVNNDKAKVKPAKDSTLKRVAVGAGTGLLIGGISTVLMGMKIPDESDMQSGESNANNHRDTLSNPEWVDDQVAIATSVNDEMSFSEAFAAARAEVGPGGAFEWNGQIYGTYTAEEWNGMTAEQRAEYGDHFSWNHIDQSQSDVAQHSSAAQQSSLNTTAQNTEHDEIEVVSVNHVEGHDIAQQVPEDVEVQPVEPEIEILGVVHDDETDANIGGMIVDGQDVILIDVDNDLSFDYMASDANGNGQIDQNEIVDIQGQNLTVNDLGGFSNPVVDDSSNDEGLGYSNDGVYEG